MNNDLKYVVAPGFPRGQDFFVSLKDAFDLLWEEGAQIPRMMSVGLHGRLSGHPARAAALARFLDYAAAREQVWICRRLDIARHWLATYPAPAD